MYYFQEKHLTVLCTLQGEWLPIYTILYYVVVYRDDVFQPKKPSGLILVKGSSGVIVFILPTHCEHIININKYNFYQTQSSIFLLPLHVSISNWSSSNVLIRKKTSVLNTSKDDQIWLKHVVLKRIIKGSVWWKLYLFILIKWCCLPLACNETPLPLWLLLIRVLS
jgi:hypothetical protein